MKQIFADYIKPSIAFNSESAKLWNRWLIYYTVIAVIILALAALINAYLSIAEVIIIYPIAKTITARRECDINNGKLIDKLDAIGRIDSTQEKMERDLRIEEESEKQR